MSKAIEASAFPPPADSILDIQNRRSKQDRLTAQAGKRLVMEKRSDRRTSDRYFAQSSVLSTYRITLVEPVSRMKQEGE
jgi:hypothetical protein